MLNYHCGANDGQTEGAHARNPTEKPNAIIATIFFDRSAARQIEIEIDFHTISVSSAGLLPAK